MLDGAGRDEYPRYVHGRNMNERVERNYPLRKPLLIKWSFVFYTILVLFFSFISHPVHAGFFSNLFSSASADDENIQSSLVSGEELSSPLAFPLLGSKNIPPPDKEEIKNIRDASALPLATTGDSALIGSRNPLGTLPANNEDQSLSIRFKREIHLRPLR